MLYYLFAVVYVLSCFLLLLVVLLQQGKGGDMASAFGGGGSQTAFGARAGATVLTKATAVLGVVFMLGAIGLGIMGQRGPGSLMRGLSTPASAPAAPLPKPTPAPTGSAPAAPTVQTPATNQTPAAGTKTPEAPTPAPEQPKK